MIEGLPGGSTAGVRPERAREILAAMRGLRVVVVGDLMLDRYIWGAVSRISPEAPVPVVEVAEESERLGGAANVVNNLRGLGAQVDAVGVVGDDYHGGRILELLRKEGTATHGIVVEAGRTTTVKTRVIAHGQHVVRVDRENRAPIRPQTEKALLDRIRHLVVGADALIFEDYNKGVLTPSLIRETLELTGEMGIVTAVDPKFENFFEYRGATLFKPNRREAEAVLGASIRTYDDLVRTGEHLKRRLECRYLMITLGEDGLCLFGDDGGIAHCPTDARKVADVSGAGDTVISTAALALAAGASPEEAAVLANRAAGVVCGQVGVVPVTADALLASVAAGTPGRPDSDAERSNGP